MKAEGRKTCLFVEALRADALECHYSERASTIGVKMQNIEHMVGPFNE